MTVVRQSSVCRPTPPCCASDARVARLRVAVGTGSDRGLVQVLVRVVVLVQCVALEAIAYYLAAKVMTPPAMAGVDDGARVGGTRRLGQSFGLWRGRQPSSRSFGLRTHFRSPAPGDLGDDARDSVGCEFVVCVLAAGAPAAAAKALSDRLRSHNRHFAPPPAPSRSLARGHFQAPP